MDLLISIKTSAMALRKSRVGLLTLNELKMNGKKLSVNVHRLKEN